MANKHRKREGEKEGEREKEITFVDSKADALETKDIRPPGLTHCVQDIRKVVFLCNSYAHVETGRLGKYESVGSRERDFYRHSRVT